MRSGTAGGGRTLRDVSRDPAYRGGRRDPGQQARVYRRRRLMAGSFLVLGLAALIFAIFVQAPEATGESLPINPSSADPDEVLADVAESEVSISTPVRPTNLTVLGYHPEGGSLLAMEPLGENLSANPLLGVFAGGASPDGIKYHVMDRADRRGPSTGALDVGAPAGTPVHAPVTGVVTAIRPDPTVEGASIVELKPDADPDVRVSVSLVQDVGSDVGPDTPVEAGITEIGAVADSATVLEPQLAGHTSEPGNHVTVAVAPAS